MEEVEMKKKFLFFFALALFVVQQAFAASTAKFPFPQDQTYGSNGSSYGIKPTGANHNDVQAAYKIFVNNYYVESGDYARIEWDTPEYTVSEGIGYGMLIMVFMDNDSNNTKSKFDKLWAYYKKYKNGNGLMDWKISGFNSANQTGGATDGDLDVALALALASYQWDASYKSDATTLLDKIYTYEVESGTNYLKPGDSWGSNYPYNPSYFVTAGLGMFESFDNTRWSSVKTAAYSMLKTISGLNSTGLVPDWCSSTGTSYSGKSYDYTFDAARTPWRMAMAYCWHGDADAKTVAAKINTWIKGTTTGGDPSKIGEGYTLAGSSSVNTCIPVYLGPFACAAMVDANSQAWLDACYTKLASFIDDDNYYNQSLKVLSLLLLTGNALDYSSATAKTSFTITSTASPSSAGSVVISPSQTSYTKGTSVTITATPSGSNKFVSWGGDLSGTTAAQTITIQHDMIITAYFNAGAGDLVDNCEDNDSLTNLGTAWFTYNDSICDGKVSGAKSRVHPKTSDKDMFTMTAITRGGVDSSNYGAKITYYLDSGTYKYNPFVGMGFMLKKSKTDTTLDISSSTGLTFSYLGDSCDVRIETANITDYGYYFKRIPKCTQWKQVSVAWTDMAQASWAKTNTLDLTKATKIEWQSPNNFGTGDSGEIFVDDIHLTGYTISTPVLKQNVSEKKTTSDFAVSADNARLNVSYTVKTTGMVSLNMYDLSGKLVHRIFNGNRQAGRFSEKVNLAGTGLTHGTYLVQLKNGVNTVSDKVILVK
jgi:endoglucanase